MALHSNGELHKEDRLLMLDWILSLANFDRLVFVMSVLDRYSDHDWAVLVGCSPRQVGEARVRGFRQVIGPLLMVA
jgi:hypothetical protein